MSSNPPSAFRRSVYSSRCSSAEEYWDRTHNRCVSCSVKHKIKPGHEFSPNCGQSDDEGMHELPYRKCSDGTFNNGEFIWCSLCSICPSSQLLSRCTSISDSRCCGEEDCRNETQPTTTRSTVITTDHLMTTASSKSSTNHLMTTASSKSSTNHLMTTASSKSYTETTISSETIQSTYSAKTTQTDPNAFIRDPNHHSLLTVSTALTITILLCACLLCLLYIIKKKKHRGCREMKKCFSKRSLSNLADSREHFKLGTTEDIKDINDLLSPEIQAAPLQSVLNNMDVVEELVLLLDPDIPGAKNTRHLAASCSIPFTWINYAYSMKDSRSPLIAVLERVIAKYPYWNVGHLAGLLSNIGRNDAVAVLGKLTVTAMEA
ncbi:IGF-like family receptor 1 [Colossoma macropomum]|uniref:IGF-like family receptor 1 n=1 Tax=Colossoma macropomum TaxID=42526 RepID=UPI0018647798|nr:IGF-like family receptor 1 [Colossoma macropomum]